MDPAQIKKEVESLLRKDPGRALPIALQAVIDHLEAWKTSVRQSTDAQLRLAAEESLFGRKLNGIDQWRSVLYLAEPYSRYDGTGLPPVGYEDIFREFCGNLEGGKQGMFHNHGADQLRDFVAENGPWFAQGTLLWLMDMYGKGGERARD